MISRIISRFALSLSSRLPSLGGVFSLLVSPQDRLPFILGSLEYALGLVRPRPGVQADPGDGMSFIEMMDEVAFMLDGLPGDFVSADARQHLDGILDTLTIFMETGPDDVWQSWPGHAATRRELYVLVQHLIGALSPRPGSAPVGEVSA